MPHAISRRRLLAITAGAGGALAAGLAASPWSPTGSLAADAPAGDSPQQRAESLGVKFEKLKPGYLNLCVREGNLLITSGHTSTLAGKLGVNLTTQQGYEAARECAIKTLQSVWNTHGTLDGLRVLKVLGCVNCSPDFVEQPQVINGCSDLLHQVFGKETDGYHARSALGFASLPSGRAVEVEAIFAIKG